VYVCLQCSRGGLSFATSTTTRPPTPNIAYRIYRSESGDAVDAAAGGAAAGGLSLDDMERAMQSIMGGAPQGPQSIPLSKVLTSDILLQLIEKPEYREVLMPLLPEGQQTVADLRDLIRSPQLQQSLRSLSQALMTENLNAVMANTGLDPAHGAEALQQGDGAFIVYCIVLMCVCMALMCIRFECSCLWACIEEARYHLAVVVSFAPSGILPHIKRSCLTFCSFQLNPLK